MKKLNILFVEEYKGTDSFKKLIEYEFPDLNLIMIKNEKELNNYLNHQLKIDLLIFEPIISEDFLFDKEGLFNFGILAPGLHIFLKIKDLLILFDELKIIILSTLSEEELYNNNFPINQNCIFLQKTILPEDLVKKIDELFY